MASVELLILDEIPRSALEEFITFSKVFLKEGVWHGEWKSVFNYGRSFGSKKIPRSLVEGLRNKGISFSHNDFSVSQAKTVAAIKDVRCLRWALEKKKSGEIQNLIAGPFIATLPSECDGILLDPQIDYLLFLSEWHRNLFIKESGRKLENTRVWYAGVDTEFWKDITQPKEQILIYNKIQTRDPFNQVINYLNSQSYPYTILNYGEFTPEQFRAEINRSRFAIFLHESETQGLVTFETWSCNVPTLHWDPETMFFMGKKYPGAETCPYLSDRSGMKFNQISQFENAFQEMEKRLSSFKPREVVLNQYTIGHSADRFLSIINERPNENSSPL
jgi:hypothetical protein